MPGLAGARLLRSHQLDDLVSVLCGQLLWVFAGLHHKSSILRCGVEWNMHSVHGGMHGGDGNARTSVTSTATATVATTNIARMSAVHSNVWRCWLIAMVSLLCQRLWRLPRNVSARQWILHNSMHINDILYTNACDDN